MEKLLVQWDFSFEMPDSAFNIIEEGWEDGDEWAIIEVIDPVWQTFISLKHQHRIIDGT